MGAAHGHDPYFMAYSGKRWGRDYGIISGECNWQAIGTVIGVVLGVVLGGVVGAKVSKPEDRAIAVILGGVIGAVIGNRIGKSVDDNGRACIGHALELAHDRKTVRWVNPYTGTHYRVTPLSGFAQNGRKCRIYALHQWGR